VLARRLLAEDLGGFIMHGFREWSRLEQENQALRQRLEHGPRPNDPTSDPTAAGIEQMRRELGQLHQSEQELRYNELDEPAEGLSP
jgi:hypothetical protein